MRYIQGIVAASLVVFGVYSVFVLASEIDEPAEIRILGRAYMYPLGHDRSVLATYYYAWDSSEHQGLLTIYVEGMDAKFHYMPEVGQEFIRNINMTRFGTLGDLICVDSARGAPLNGLRVYMLSSDNNIVVVFDGACRFGYEIIDVTGNGIPEIIGGYGDLHANNKEMRIYSWNGSDFAMIDQIQVVTPHLYDIRRD